jgi:flagellar hook assembly protein FlgD
VPEEGKTLGLTLELSKSARTTIEVVDQYNQVLATITHRRQRGSGVHSFYWDGYDDFGNVIPSGSYLIQAIASTAGASVRSVVPITIYEDPLAHNQYRRQTTPALTQEQPQEVSRRTSRRSRR